FNTNAKPILRSHVSSAMRPASNIADSTRTRSNRVLLIPKTSRSVSDNSYEGDLKIGMRISHMRFGFGTITNLEGRGENAKATVEFDNAGTKQLLLKFAKITVIH
ncbi:MAG: ATP-dependent DNA helicase, partial [Prevotella sp.]|nr:ATP-dependent DNA helicase [Prevotella sp.]